MDNTNKNLLLSLKLLLKNGIHFGHSISKYNSTNKNFIYGSRNNIHIFNLEHTFYQLKKIMLFIQYQKLPKNSVLFVGTKRHVSFLTKLIAKQSNQLYIDTKWTPGLLTNQQQLRGFLDKLIILENKILNNSFISPKELAIYKKLKFKYKGLLTQDTNSLGKLPKLIVVFNPDDKDGIMAINEASQMLIPSIGIVDSNSSNANITYPIPGNNNSIESISMFGTLLTNILNETKNVKTIKNFKRKKYTETNNKS